MNTPLLSPGQIARVSEMVARFISDQRARYFPEASPLSAEQTGAMAGFFSADALAKTRILELKGEEVITPPFYPTLMSLGFTNLPELSRMDSITFFDTIVLHAKLTDDVFFHELVHVEQFRQLGLQKFADLYVRGFLDGGGYDGIPLEQNAYLLGARYEENPARQFSVAEVVADWISAGRF